MLGRNSNKFRAVIAHFCYVLTALFYYPLIMPASALDLPPSASIGITFHEDPSLDSESGTVISNLGDFNGDGFDDFAIATRNTISSTDGDRVYVVYGGNSFPTNVDLPAITRSNGLLGFSLLGGKNNNLGRQIAGGCDVNKNEFTDLIIGAPDRGVKHLAGEVYVIYGKDTASEPIIGEISTDDIINRPELGIVIQGGEDFSHIGSTIECLQDINGDLVDDILIGTEIASSANSKNVNPGEAYVIYGAENLPPVISINEIKFPVPIDDNSKGFVIRGQLFTGDSPADTRPDNFSQAIANAGDINGDNINDFMIASPHASPIDRGTAGGAYRSGQVYVIFGRDSGFSSPLNVSDIVNGDGSTGFAVNGAHPYDNLGAAMSAAGNFDKDVFNDIIIASPNFGENSTPGQAYIIFGKNSTTAPTTSPIETLTLNDSGITISGFEGNAGTAVSGLGDINADGIDDIAISAPLYHELVHINGEVHQFGGVTYILMGRDKTAIQNSIFLSDLELEDPRVNLVLFGKKTTDHAGHAISGVGDVNGDGANDILISAPKVTTGFEPSLINSGQTYLIFGGSELVRSDKTSSKLGLPNGIEIVNSDLPQASAGMVWWLLLVITFYSLRHIRNKIYCSTEK